MKVDAMSGACDICGEPLRRRSTGRPARYCSAACRQRSYRLQHQPAAHEPPGRDSAPHLSDAELASWRGMLELQARLLPILDAELRQRRGLSINDFDVLYQLWRMPGH